MARGGKVERKSVSARKLYSEIDSEDLAEKIRNDIVVDINLLNGAMERSLVCKSCHCPVFCKELEERSGQGVRLGFVCTNANCSLIQLIGSQSILDAKIKILRPPVGTGFKLSL